VHTCARVSSACAPAVRHPHAVGIAIEYDALQPGHILLPGFLLHNEEGVKVLEAVDLDPEWRRRPRPAGRYVSTGWIPGNLLSEGMFFVSCDMVTLMPVIKQFDERDAAAFQVVDSLDGDSARGDWGGRMNSAVRPLLRWCTQFNAQPGVLADEQECVGELVPYRRIGGLSGPALQ
jgi:lipopolysaccharide transport system ATP-binding protein